jgi:hypothetical protein
MPAVAGKTYTASAFFKTDLVQDGPAYLSVNFWTVDGAYIPATIDSPRQLDGTNDWTQLLVQAKAPARAAFARIEFRLSGRGRMWVDDASLHADPADSTPPQTTITDGPSGTVPSLDASFSFTADESGSGFACSLDGAPFAACRPPQPYSTLARGDHLFAVRAIDPAGSVDPTPATRSWTVSALPGEINIAPNPGFEHDPVGSYFTSGPADFSWASDAAHDGNRSLKVVSTTDALSRWLSRTTAITVTPGGDYQATVYARTENLSGQALLSITYWTASGLYVPAAADSPLQLGATHGWTKLTSQATAPSTAVTIRVEFRITGAGIAWFDDVDIQRR